MRFIRESYQLEVERDYVPIIAVWDSFALMSMGLNTHTKDTELYRLMVLVDRMKF
jgi:hypothetical protein